MSSSKAPWTSWAIPVLGGGVAVYSLLRHIFKWPQLGGLLVVFCTFYLLLWWRDAIVREDAREARAAQRIRSEVMSVVREELEGKKRRKKVVDVDAEGVPKTVVVKDEEEHPLLKRFKGGRYWSPR